MHLASRFPSYRLTECGSAILNESAHRHPAGEECHKVCWSFSEGRQGGVALGLSDPEFAYMLGGLVPKLEQGPTGNELSCRRIHE